MYHLLIMSMKYNCIEINNLTYIIIINLIIYEGIGLRMEDKNWYHLNEESPLTRW